MGRTHRIHEVFEIKIGEILQESYFVCMHLKNRLYFLEALGNLLLKIFKIEKELYRFPFASNFMPRYLRDCG